MKNFEEFLLESTYNWKWIYRNPKLWIARINTGTELYKIRITKKSGVWEIDLGTLDKLVEKDSSVAKYLIEIMKDFTENEKPQSFELKTPFTSLTRTKWTKIMKDMSHVLNIATRITIYGAVMYVIYQGYKRGLDFGDGGFGDFGWLS